MRTIITLTGAIRFYGINSSFTVIRVQTAVAKMRKMVREHYQRGRQVAFTYYD